MGRFRKRAARTAVPVTTIRTAPAARPARCAENRRARRGSARDSQGQLRSPSGREKHVLGRRHPRERLRAPASRPAPTRATRAVGREGRYLLRRAWSRDADRACGRTPRAQLQTPAASVSPDLASIQEIRRSARTYTPPSPHGRESLFTPREVSPRSKGCPPISM